MKGIRKNKNMYGILGIVIVGLFMIGIWFSRSTSSSLLAQDQSFENIAPQEAYELIQQHKDDPKFVILDVRTPQEFESGHLENAVNIDYYAKTFRENLAKLDKTKQYFVYCRSGNRSGNTLKLMEQLGFTKAYNLSGGIAGWNAEKLPVTK